MKCNIRKLQGPTASYLARFSRVPRQRAEGRRELDRFIETTLPDPTDVDVIEYAEVSGNVTDENGKPVVGAKVP